jgi:hypothetical protein
MKISLTNNMHLTLNTAGNKHVIPKTWSDKVPTLDGSQKCIVPYA